jgi:hypothetical protein
MEHYLLLIWEFEIKIFLKDALLARYSLSSTSPSSDCSNYEYIRVTNKISGDCHFDFDVCQRELSTDNILAGEIDEDLSKLLSSAISQSYNIFALS